MMIIIIIIIIIIVVVVAGTIIIIITNLLPIPTNRCQHHLPKSCQWLTMSPPRNSNKNGCQWLTVSPPHNSDLWLPTADHVPQSPTISSKNVTG